MGMEGNYGLKIIQIQNLELSRILIRGGVLLIQTLFLLILMGFCFSLLDQVITHISNYGEVMVLQMEPI